MAAASGIAPEWVEYSSAAASTVGEFDADEFSMAEGASEASGMHRLPDFKSMLEAALRGDVVSCSSSLVMICLQLNKMRARRLLALLSNAVCSTSPDMACSALPPHSDIAFAQRCWHDCLRMCHATVCCK